MLDHLAARGARLAAARAEARRARLTAALREAAPAGVTVAQQGAAVILAGRGLARRAVTDPEIRWLVAEARDGER